MRAGIGPRTVAGLLAVAAVGIGVAWILTTPGTEDIVSFAPFNSMPTMYRVTVDGRQSWFAQ